jgi:anti-sigma regulatory factor (Ser/Thr protein kinase)
MNQGPTSENGSIEIAVASAADKKTAMTRARDLGKGMGFGKSDLDKIDLIICELCTNAVKYGQGLARIEMAAFRENGNRGLEILYSAPEGTGIASTASPSLGIGLAVIRNHVDEFSMGAMGQAGISLHLRKFLPNGTPPHFLANTSVFTAPAIGQTQNGDGFFIDRPRHRILLAVFDVLGHGPGAHSVAKDLLKVFQTCPGWDLGPLLRRTQKAISGSRGAAIAAVSINLHTGIGEYIGVGNVEARWLKSKQKISLVPVPGILGRSGQKIRVESFEVESSGLLLLASDGISLRHLATDIEDIAPADPMVLTELLMRNRSRPLDDRTVMAVHIHRNPMRQSREDIRTSA